MLLQINIQFSPDKTSITPSELPVESEKCPVITDHRPLFAALIIIIYIMLLYSMLEGEEFEA